MAEAWNTTYREFCLLEDVRSEMRTLRKKQVHFDEERMTGLEDHLRNLGVL